MGRVSSVDIAALYGLGGPEFEYRWGARFSAPVHTGPGAYPASYTMGTGAFFLRQSGQGMNFKLLNYW